MFNKMFWVFIALFFCFARDSYAELKFAHLNSRPLIKAGHNSFAGKEYVWLENLGIDVRLAVNEAEGILVLLHPNEASEYVLTYNENPFNGIKLSVYRLKNVLRDNGDEVPDPLIPVSSGGHLTLSPDALLFIKATSLPFAAPASLSTSITVRNVKSGSLSSVNLAIHVLPVILPEDTGIIAQATVWPYSKWTRSGEIYAEDRIKQVLKGLADNRINGLSGLWPLEYKVYEKVARFALDDLSFKSVCLPALEMFSPWGNSQRLEAYWSKSHDERSLIADLRRHLGRFKTLLSNENWEGKFSYWIWDEPREADYPYVVQSYKAAKKAYPALRLQLTKQPAEGLEDVVDIWVPYIPYLNISEIERQHHFGKQIWIYANKVHGIDHPQKGMRILGWILWKYKLDGYLFWAVNWWKEDPWTTVSSQKKDFLKRGTLVYPDPDSGTVYASLRLEAFRDGIEDMLLLKQLEKKAEGKGPAGDRARQLVQKLKDVYVLAERYDNAPDPVQYRGEILNALVDNGVQKMVQSH